MRRCSTTSVQILVAGGGFEPPTFGVMSKGSTLSPVESIALPRPHLEKLRRTRRILHVSVESFCRRVSPLVFVEGFSPLVRANDLLIHFLSNCHSRDASALNAF